MSLYVAHLNRQPKHKDDLVLFKSDGVDDKDIMLDAQDAMLTTHGHKDVDFFELLTENDEGFERPVKA